MDPVAKLAAFHLYRAAMEPRLARGDLTEEALFAEFLGFIAPADLRAMEIASDELASCRGRRLGTLNGHPKRSTVS